MKLLTLNTHSLIEPDYEAKRDAFVDFIAEEQPDVFALQEVNQTAAAPLLGEAPAGYYPCSGAAFWKIRCHNFQIERKKLGKM